MQLLAVSGPFHYWGPVVDGQYLREAPARALQRAPRAKVDLLIGSSQDDGLINRAKAVKVGGRGLGCGPGTLDLSKTLVKSHGLARLLFSRQSLKSYMYKSSVRNLGDGSGGGVQK